MQPQPLKKKPCEVSTKGGSGVHFSRATVHHEVIPGHHLQGYMNARHRPWRRTFRTPFWTEGWALYWEFRLWDLGFPQSPENRIGASGPAPVVDDASQT